MNDCEKEIKLLNLPNIRKNYYTINEDGVVKNILGKTINQFNSMGYKRVKLLCGDGDYRKNFSVHRLVAYTFIGNPPKNMKNPSIDHINSIRTCNNYKNLRWQEFDKNAKKCKNSDHPYSKLTEDNVKCICSNLNNHRSDASIGREFGVSSTTIQAIRCRYGWTKISNDYLNKPNLNNVFKTPELLNMVNYILHGLELYEVRHMKNDKPTRSILTGYYYTAKEFLSEFKYDFNINDINKNGNMKNYSDWR